jgi:hypothetical protein
VVGAGDPRMRLSTVRSLFSRSGEPRLQGWADVKHMYACRTCMCMSPLQSLERLGRLEEGNVSEAFSQLSSR